MISPTGSASPPRIPTVSSRPAMNCSIITSSSCSNASVDRRVELGRLLHDREPDRRPLLRRLHDHRQPSARSTAVALGGVDGSGRHQPVGRAHAGRSEEMLRQILVHRERARQMPAAGVGHPARSSSAWRSRPRPGRRAARGIPRRSRRASVDAPRCPRAIRRSSAPARSGGWQLSSRRAPRAGVARRRATARPSRCPPRDVVSARAQRFRDPKPRRERDVALRRGAAHQYRDSHWSVNSEVRCSGARISAHLDIRYASMSLRVTIPSIVPARRTSTAGFAFESSFWTDSTVLPGVHHGKGCVHHLADRPRPATS